MLESDSGCVESLFALISVGLPTGQWIECLDELATDSALKGRTSLRKETRCRQMTRMKQKVLSHERDVRCGPSVGIL